MKDTNVKFIAYPSAVQYEAKGTGKSAKGTGPMNQLIWGDWARVEKVEGGWSLVRSRGNTGWVRDDQLQDDRILEINFVDIGQGDGCHIQTPKDRAIIIDAGEGDNMYRFLRWRFGKFAKKFKFQSVVITHPDSDHYHGFSPLLEDPNVLVGTMFHNTLVDRVTNGKKGFGSEKTVGKTTFFTDLVVTKAALGKILGDPKKNGKSLYGSMLNAAIKSGRVDDFVGLLASEDLQVPEYLPGYGPKNRAGLTIKLLGPVPESINGEKPCLRKLSAAAGKNKNGHSVVLLLEIGNIKILLGGDLNLESQKYLLNHYSSGETRKEAMVLAARQYLGVDVAKACHHGSSDINPLFLSATNPLATVVSSGDAEPHSHPRPDALGMIGKFSRSDRPLIFCTELARSGNETIKHPNVVRAELKATIEKETLVLNDPDATDSAKEKAQKHLDDAMDIIQRSVANYGMISLRTDGEKMIITQRLEQDRSKEVRWDIHQFKPDTNGQIKYVP